MRDSSGSLSPTLRRKRAASTSSLASNTTLTRKRVRQSISTQHELQPAVVLSPRPAAPTPRQTRNSLGLRSHDNVPMYEPGSRHSTPARAKPSAFEELIDQTCLDSPGDPPSRIEKFFSLEPSRRNSGISQLRKYRKEELISLVQLFLKENLQKTALLNTFQQETKNTENELTDDGRDHSPGRGSEEGVTLKSNQDVDTQNDFSASSPLFLVRIPTREDILNRRTESLQSGHSTPCLTDSKESLSYLEDSPTMADFNHDLCINVDEGRLNAGDDSAVQSGFDSATNYQEMRNASVQCNPFKADEVLQTRIAVTSRSRRPRQLAAMKEVQTEEPFATQVREELQPLLDQIELLKQEQRLLVEQLKDAKNAKDSQNDLLIELNKYIEVVEAEKKKLSTLVCKIDSQLEPPHQEKNHVLVRHSNLADSARACVYANTALHEAVILSKQDRLAIGILSIKLSDSLKTMIKCLNHDFLFDLAKVLGDDLNDTSIQSMSLLVQEHQESVVKILEEFEKMRLAVLNSTYLEQSTIRLECECTLVKESCELDTCITDLRNAVLKAKDKLISKVSSFEHRTRILEHALGTARGELEKGLSEKTILREKNHKMSTEIDLLQQQIETMTSSLERHTRDFVCLESEYSEKLDQGEMEIQLLREQNLELSAVARDRAEVHQGERQALVEEFASYRSETSLSLIEYQKKVDLLGSRLDALVTDLSNSKTLSLQLYGSLQKTRIRFSTDLHDKNKRIEDLHSKILVLRRTLDDGRHESGQKAASHIGILEQTQFTAAKSVDGFAKDVPKGTELTNCPDLALVERDLEGNREMRSQLERRLRQVQADLAHSECKSADLSTQFLEQEESIFSLQSQVSVLRQGRADNQHQLGVQRNEILARDQMLASMGNEVDNLEKLVLESTIAKQNIDKELLQAREKQSETEKELALLLEKHNQLLEKHRFSALALKSAKALAIRINDLTTSDWENQ